MDNASGVATLIEIARALGEPDRRPKRSIVLLALTAEEEGLLGSRAFAVRPPRTVGTMVANLNLDMFLPIVPLRATTAYGVDESTLGDRYRSFADSANVVLAPDPAPEQTYFIRSDQFNFVREGIPALFFEFAAVPGDSATARRLRAWGKRYHAPSDDARQPVDLKAAGAFNRLLTRFTQDVANAPERSAWHADSFFAGFARARPAER
jgi:Zn-dependent M28 family amino/carboxypeptidase